jgi:hypothetical protein
MSRKNNYRVGIKANLGQGRAGTDEKVKYQVPSMSHSVFHIIPKNPQVKHIPEKMHPAAVKEHGRKNFNPLGRRVSNQIPWNERPLP